MSAHYKQTHSNHSFYILHQPKKQSMIIAKKHPAEGSIPSAYTNLYSFKFYQNIKNHFRVEKQESKHNMQRYSSNRKRRYINLALRKLVCHLSFTIKLPIASTLFILRFCHRKQKKRRRRKENENRRRHRGF